MWDAETCQLDPLPTLPPLVPNTSIVILSIAAACIFRCFIPVVVPHSVSPKSSAENRHPAFGGFLA